MSLSRWLIVLGLAVGIGMLITAQRIAVFMEGYVVGERMHQVHEEEVALGWVNHQVTGASSPVNLARDAQSRHLNLVASSSLQDLSLQQAPKSSTSEPQPVAMARDTSD